MSIFAGGLHVVMMQVIILITAAAYYALRNRNGWWRPAATIALYYRRVWPREPCNCFHRRSTARRAVRFITGTALPATQKIPIAYLVDSISPARSSGMLFSWNFQAKLGPGEVLSPYLGVFPLLLAVVGFWKCRDHLWVRYSAGLVAAAFLFSLGAVFVIVWIDLCARATALDGARGQPLPLYRPLRVGDSGGLRRADFVCRPKHSFLGAAERRYHAMPSVRSGAVFAIPFYSASRN